MNLGFLSRFSLLVVLCGLLGSSSAAGCILSDFQISTEPSLPAAGSSFDMVVDYLGSAGCINSQALVVEPPILRVEIDCDCVLITTFPVPQEFRPMVAGLPAGLYQVDVVNTASGPSPTTIASAQVLVGLAPAVPLSPPALFILALTLAAAAVWFLRR